MHCLGVGSGGENNCICVGVGSGGENNCIVVERIIALW